MYRRFAHPQSRDSFSHHYLSLFFFIILLVTLPFSTLHLPLHLPPTVSRGTETEEKIAIRLTNAREELEYGYGEGNFDKVSKVGREKGGKE